MSMRRSILTLGILMAVILLASPAFTADNNTDQATKKKADTTSATAAPAEVHAIMQKAINNPPITLPYLSHVYVDADVQLYLASYEKLTVNLNSVLVTFTKERGIKITGTIDKNPMDTKIKTFEVGVNMDSDTLDCEGSSDRADTCTTVKNNLASTSQDTFWKAVKTAIAERTASLK